MSLILSANGDNGTVSVTCDTSFTQVDWKPTVSSTWVTSVYSGASVTTLPMHPPPAISWDFRVNGQTATTILPGRGAPGFAVWLNDTANMSNGVALGGVVNWTSLGLDYVESMSAVPMLGRQFPVQYFAPTNYQSGTLQFWLPNSYPLVNSGGSNYALNDIAMLESFRALHQKTLLYRDPTGLWVPCKLNAVKPKPDSGPHFTVSLDIQTCAMPSPAVY